MADYESSFSGFEIDKAVDLVLNGTTHTVVTMLAGVWSGNEYFFEGDFPSDQYDIEIAVSGTATAEQFEAFGAAMIGSDAEKNVVVALGDVPTVDIPVVVKAVRK